MTLVDLRLAYRMHRFEIVGFGVLIAMFVIAAVMSAAQLDATGYGWQCRQDVGPNPIACEAMGRAFYALQQTQVPMVAAILLALPFLLGALVGAPLVARELERGTSRLAWSLAPSRFRWYLVRLLPVLVVVFGFAFVAGVALDRLTGATEPGSDMANSFAGFGTRGVVVAARVTFVLAIGVAVGAVMGRMLPALILTAAIATVGLAGGSLVHGKILASEAVFVDGEWGNGNSGDLFIDQRIRAPGGDMLTWDQLYAIAPPPEDGSDWPPAGYTFVSLVVPGERYRFVEAREVAALAGGSLVALAIGALAVRRRRPG
jgi:hypothetical protein